MKSTRLLLAACAALFLAALGHAETIKLRVSDALALKSAIEALDQGQQVILDQGTEAKKVVPQPFEFTGNVRFALAQNLAALRPVAESYEAQRVALIRRIGGAAGIAPDDGKRMLEFQERNQALLDAEVEVDVRRIALADWKLEHNPIPAAVLASLIRLLPPATP